MLLFWKQSSNFCWKNHICQKGNPRSNRVASKHQYFGGFLFLSLLQVGVCCCTVKECLVTHTHSIKETHLPETLTYGKVKQHSFPCQKSDQRGSQERRGWIGNGITLSSNVNAIRATWKVNLSMTVSPFSWPPLNGNYLYKRFYNTSVQLLVYFFPNLVLRS